MSKKGVGKQSRKLKIPSTNNKAYERLIKNMSMFSLESPNASGQSKTFMNKKHNYKKIEGGKKKRKGSNAR